MIDFFRQFNPLTQVLFATLFTWGVTAAGAALVLFVKNLNRRLLDCMLGFAAGVMIAASFWSLIAPGIEMAEQLGHVPWLTATIGFMGGGIFMRVTDLLLPHIHPGLAMSEREGIKTSWQRLGIGVGPSEPIEILLNFLKNGPSKTTYRPIFRGKIRVIAFVAEIARLANEEGTWQEPIGITFRVASGT